MSTGRKTLLCLLGIVDREMGNYAVSGNMSIHIRVQKHFIFAAGQYKCFSKVVCCRDKCLLISEQWEILRNHYLGH